MERNSVNPISSRPLAQQQEATFREKVLSLLNKDERRAYDKESKRVYTDNENSFIFIPDIYLKSGCKNLSYNGVTCIEFVDELTYLMAHRYNRLIQELEKLNGCDIANFVVIYRRSNIDDEDMESIFHAIKTLSIEELDKIVSMRKADNPLQENSILDKVKNAFEYGNVVLFLGAGVSMSAGLPSWERLLKDVLKNGIDASENDFKFISEQCHHSSIIAARYIKILHHSNHSEAPKEEFLTLLHKGLYSSYQKKRMIDEKSEISPLLTSIGNMVASKKVESVITYNYDDLLEQELNRQNVRAVTMNDKSKYSPARGEVPIYHVHGTLFYDDKILPESDVVLCEDEYHNMYKESFSWPTVEQLHALRNKTCMFIGLSMSDPNLRRLLDFAWDKKRGWENRHFVFLQNKTYSKFHTSVNADTMKRMMSEFGLDVVWYKSYEDLPKMLNMLTENSISKKR